MSSRPLIGLTGPQTKARDAQMFLAVLDDSDIDIFFADYAPAVIEAGGLPLLGIGRGLQLLNVAANGTINQHGPEHAFIDGPPEPKVHAVTFEPSSTLFKIYGPSLDSNSLHHQSVAETGPPCSDRSDRRRISRSART